MEFAVNVPTSAGDSVYSQLAFCDSISWADQLAFATSMETLGFDGIAVPDHVMTGSGPTTECFVTLAAIARETDDVYLYPKTVNNHLRNPALLAKQAATLDAVSDGRLKLGMGAGWKESEARAYGYDWPGAPTRLRMLEESIRLIQRLWTEDTVDFDGDYYTLDGAMCRPHPVQEPRPPIMVGGGGESFTLRITAQYADSWNFWGPPEVMQHKLDVLERHCDGYGRPFDDIERSWFARCLIREDEAELDALLDEHFPRFKPENRDESEFPLVGTPSALRDDIQTFVDMGFEEVVVEFVDFPETTSAELFAEHVAPAFQ
ncbi:Flavin-dependent oxidoreductase, luciferase family (includes alkanesulfonate monooxygenase SsuD and methylene tetrahydromethanopterin reductase) [Halogranum rubrum]|uniref:Flavin-dependent oxidoreductase, luciferase family (Includes alkanesulfonate monooxygenase SsuD and methylene tetrahydromethanopterin reductase) n=1 Tax=Halogranum rubrum TaxID=553466 RepID=A0A1I4FGC5_9EURY|nr:LLM class flavin-dependent oxidoreductase [Halogranum rubrum]SFL15501.1 Flavin-dependent oxidoreductase, luciferase family (includes alkanesulfonate monooxygenase SsuD and methylene tetrahydromethanopterin reductase) [Halogranum rubrum]